MRILITGINGLLGMNLAMQAARQHEVVGVDRLTLPVSDIPVINADLLEMDSFDTIFEEARPDWIVHCVAMTDVEVCETRPAEAQRLNAWLPGVLAEASRKAGIGFLYISTDAVFDGMQGAYREDDTPAPLSVYAATKLAGEVAVTYAYPEALITRVNFYGWSMSGRRSIAEWFLNNLRSGNHISGFSDVMFCPLLANDLADTMIAMMGKSLKGVFHVVGSECVSKYRFGVTLAEKFRLDASLISPISIADSPLLARRGHNMCLNTEKISGTLGRPMPDLATGIDNFFLLEKNGYVDKLRSMAG